MRKSESHNTETLLFHKTHLNRTTTSTSPNLYVFLFVFTFPFVELGATDNVDGYDGLDRFKIISI